MSASATPASIMPTTVVALLRGDGSNIVALLRGDGSNIVALLRGDGSNIVALLRGDGPNAGPPPGRAAAMGRPAVDAMTAPFWKWSWSAVTSRAPSRRSAPIAV